MNYFKEEREISIKEIFYYVCSRWRSIAAVVVFSMIVVMAINIPGAIEYHIILGDSVIAKEIAKYMIIVGVLLGVLITIFYVMKFLFTDTIKSVNEFAMICKMDIIGKIVAKKHKNSIFDRWLRKLNGIKIVYKEKEQHAEYIAKVIGKSVQDCNNQSEKVKIAIISSNNLETAKTVEQTVGVRVDSNIELFSVGDICASPEALTYVMDAEFVILAECQGKSKYYEMEQVISKLKLWNKKILGVILIDVDAL